MPIEAGRTKAGNKITLEFTERVEGRKTYCFVYKGETPYRVSQAPNETAEEIARQLIDGKRKDPWI